MPQPRKAVLRAAALLATTLLTPIGLHAAEWEVFEAIGDVRITDANGADLGAARPGDRLETPITVETLHGGRATLTHGDDVIHVEPWSRLDLPEQEESGRLTEVIQSIGTAIFGVDRRPGREFQVTTPYLVTLVKGTAFEIEVSPAGASVAVTDGVVNVSSQSQGGGSRDVRAGESTSVSAAESVASPGSMAIEALVSTPSGLSAPELASTTAAPGNSAQAPGRAIAAQAPGRANAAAASDEAGPAANGDGNGNRSGGRPDGDDQGGHGNGNGSGNGDSGGRDNGNGNSGGGNGNSGGGKGGSGGGGGSSGGGSSGGNDSSGDENGNSGGNGNSGKGGGKGGGNDNDDRGRGGRGGRDGGNNDD